MTKKIFLIAGEASGDSIGAKLMHSIRNLNPDVKFFGVGGEKMEALGLKSLFPMSELSLLGFAEIIPHIPHLFRRIEEAADYVEEIAPDALVTIDAPAFNFRVARKLKERNSPIKRIHYVAPSVWAYKPKRAEKIASLYDYLLAILPFEPPHFEKVGLPCSYIGHPIVEEDITGGNGESFRQKNGIYKNAKVMFMMPGSRQSEIKRLLPIFKDAALTLSETVSDLHIVVLATKNFFHDISKSFENFPIKNTILTGQVYKKDAMAASDVALVKSGTGTLEVAIAGIPMVVAYKVNPLSAFTLRRMIQVKYVNIVNLLLDTQVIPELLQEDCNPEFIASSLSSLIESHDARSNQLINTKKALQSLGLGQIPSPSDKAAEIILKQISQKANT